MVPNTINLPLFYYIYPQSTTRISTPKSSHDSTSNFEHSDTTTLPATAVPYIISSSTSSIIMVSTPLTPIPILQPSPPPSSSSPPPPPPKPTNTPTSRPKPQPNAAPTPNSPNRKKNAWARPNPAPRKEPTGPQDLPSRGAGSVRFFST